MIDTERQKDAGMIASRRTTLILCLLSAVIWLVAAFATSADAATARGLDRDFAQAQALIGHHGVNRQ
jgi:hypothetical protein